MNKEQENYKIFILECLFNKRMFTFLRTKLNEHNIKCSTFDTFSPSHSDNLHFDEKDDFFYTKALEKVFYKDILAIYELPTEVLLDKNINGDLMQLYFKEQTEIFIDCIFEGFSEKMEVNVYETDIDEMQFRLVNTDGIERSKKQVATHEYFRNKSQHETAKYGEVMCELAGATIKNRILPKKIKYILQQKPENCACYYSFKEYENLLQAKSGMRKWEKSISQGGNDETLLRIIDIDNNIIDVPHDEDGFH